MKRFIGFFLKLLLKIAGIALGLFVVTFAAYYFNLDMKLVRSVVVPLLDRHYDSVHREQTI